MRPRRSSASATSASTCVGTATSAAMTSMRWPAARPGCSSRLERLEARARCVRRCTTDAPASTIVLGDLGAEPLASAGDDGSHGPRAASCYFVRSSRSEEPADGSQCRRESDRDRSRAVSRMAPSGRPAGQIAVNSGHSVATTKASAPRPALRRRGASVDGAARSSGSASTAGSKRAHRGAHCQEARGRARPRPSGAARWCRACRRGRERRSAAGASCRNAAADLPERPVAMADVARGRCPPATAAASRSPCDRSGVRKCDVARQRAAGEGRRRARDRRAGRCAARCARPRSTSAASAPTRSHSVAISLMNVTEVARNALSACLVISAASTDIQTMLRDRWARAGLRALARRASTRTPTTMRSDLVKTSIALPSRRFSGRAGEAARRPGLRPPRSAARAARSSRPAAARRSARTAPSLQERESGTHAARTTDSTSARSSSSTGVS